MNKNQKDLAKQIVIALGILGFVSIAMVMPGLSKAIPLFSKVDLRRINQEMKRLKKRGLVEIIKKKNGVSGFKLTKVGKEKLKRYNIDFLQIDRPNSWDGKWRVVIFDIPVNKNFSRELLRKKMKNLGFYKLQQSVFVYPYPCYEIVTYLRDYLGVSAEVEYLEVEKLESQNKLVEHFFT